MFSRGLLCGLTWSDWRWCTRGCWCRLWRFCRIANLTSRTCVAVLGIAAAATGPHDTNRREATERRRNDGSEGERGKTRQQLVEATRLNVPADVWMGAGICSNGPVGGLWSKRQGQQSKAKQSRGKRRACRREQSARKGTTRNCAPLRAHCRLLSLRSLCAAPPPLQRLFRVRFALRVCVARSPLHHERSLLSRRTPCGAKRTVEQPRQPSADGRAVQFGGQQIQHHVHVRSRHDAGGLNAFCAPRRQWRQWWCRRFGARSYDGRRGRRCLRSRIARLRRTELLWWHVGRHTRRRR
jgi:hypothetical protein